MLGMQDGLVALAWLLSILATIGCVVYGYANWNNGGKEK